MLTLMLRHLTRHWRINLVVLTGMAMTTTLLPGLWMCVAVIAGQNLTQSLDDAYASTRNIGVSGALLTDVIEAEVRASLGELVLKRIEVRDLIVDAVSVIVQLDGQELRLKENFFLHFWSFETFSHQVTVVTGQLPGVGTDVQDQSLVLEAVVGTRAAEQMGLETGQEVILLDGTVRVRIVGIVEPIDPGDEIWWGDELLLPFSADRERTDSTDKLFLSLIVAPETLRNHLPHHQPHWRVLLDWNKITIDNAIQIRKQLIQLEARLSANGVRVDTGLHNLIETYESRMELARVSLLLLTAQSMFAMLYTLTVISAFLLERSQLELALLVGRGFSGWQITCIFGAESAILALGVALPLGPLLALALFHLLSYLASISTGLVSIGWLSGVALKAIPGEAWALALFAAMCAWLAVVTTFHVVIHKMMRDPQHQRIRPPSRSRLQQLLIDFFLLVLGSLTYWQLLQSGSFVREVEGVGVADPVLLLGPSVLLLAVGFVLTRIFPLLLLLLSWFVQAIHGLVLPIGITRLSREPGEPRRIVLLISVTAGLVFFSTVFEDSIARRQTDIAHYLTGADLRVALPLDSRTAQEDIAEITQLPGILAASPLYQGQVRWGKQMAGTLNWAIINLLAVDTTTFQQVAYFPANVSDRSLADVLDDLQAPMSDALPVVVSPQALPRNGKIGDQMECQIGQRTYLVQVRGIVEHFPTLEEPFMVTDLSELEQRADLGAIGLASSGARELWLSTDPTQHDALVKTLQEQEITPIIAATFRGNRVAANARARLRSFQADLIAQVTTVAFKLNAFILVVLSGGSFLLVQAFAARRRQLEFVVLRAMGMSTRELLSVLALEGLTMLALGLLIGTGVGYALAHIMRPFLSLTLSSSLGGHAIDRLVVNWPVMIRLYAVMSGVYVFSLVLLLASLMRSDIGRTVRIGDE